jgi:hypothetical protein
MVPYWKQKRAVAKKTLETGSLVQILALTLHPLTSVYHNLPNFKMRTKIPVALVWVVV